MSQTQRLTPGNKNRDAKDAKDWGKEWFLCSGEQEKGKRITFFLLFYFCFIKQLPNTLIKINSCKASGNTQSVRVFSVIPAPRIEKSSE